MFSRKIEEMNPGELLEFMDENQEYLVVDVREPSEYYGDMGHIKGSQHIPLMQLNDNLDKLRNEKRS